MSQSIGLLLFVFIGWAFLSRTAGEETTVWKFNATESTNDIITQFPTQEGHSPSQQLNRCEEIKRVYYREWNTPTTTKYLTNYLTKLKRENCSEFVKQCSVQTFAFNDFTKLVYKRWCNFTEFQDMCTPDVKEATQCISNCSLNWSQLVDKLGRMKLTEEIILRPCIQVAMYGAVAQNHSEHKNTYHELHLITVPFCGIVWCGFDNRNIQEHHISHWTCMPQICRTNVIIIYVFCGILSFFIVIANASVLGVTLLNKNLRHSQGIYKMSLAIADLLVGLIVLPTFPKSMSNHFQYDQVQGTGVWVASGVNNTWTDTYQPQATSSFTWPYLRAIGFFSTVSFMASVYSLLMASFDRLSVVRLHLKYSKEDAKRFAVRACVVLWLVSAFFGSLPYYVSTLNYTLIASVFIASSGSSAMYLYIITFALPLVTLWGTSIATLWITRKHSRVARNMFAQGTNKAGKHTNTETRLARTLGIMVMVFTLSLVPILISLLLPFFMKDVYVMYPEQFNQSTFSALNSFEFVAVLILVCNSMWNFFIYSGRNADFRTATKDMYMQLWEKLGLKKLTGACFQTCRRNTDDENTRENRVLSISDSKFWTTITTIQRTARKKQSTNGNSDGPDENAV
ncbi:uncharacterized protein LOC104265620 isoform X1 [Ciona intestinalis]